jgi:hypothetical protein
MIKASDLRIGNYIASSGNHDNTETWVVGKVHSIGSMNSQFEQLEIETEEEMTWFFKDSYFGIPLTEKWLLDLGFEKWTWCNDCAFMPLFFGDSLYCRFYNNEWHIKRMKVGRDKKCVFGKTEGKYVLPKGKIKYVHQLQNLYYALTATELKREV